MLASWENGWGQTALEVNEHKMQTVGRGGQRELANRGVIRALLSAAEVPL